jgi:hypothetical protein
VEDLLRADARDLLVLVAEVELERLERDRRAEERCGRRVGLVRGERRLVGAERRWREDRRVAAAGVQADELEGEERDAVRLDVDLAVAAAYTTLCR